MRSGLSSIGFVDAIGFQIARLFSMPSWWSFCLLQLLCEPARQTRPRRRLADALVGACREGGRFAGSVSEGSATAPVQVTLARAALVAAEQPPQIVACVLKTTASVRSVTFEKAHPRVSAGAAGCLVVLYAFEAYAFSLSSGGTACLECMSAVPLLNNC